MNDGNHMSNKNGPVIGVVFETFFDSYAKEIWTGVIKAAKQIGVTMLCFAMGPVLNQDGNTYKYRRRFVYDFINPKKLDGVILVSGSLASVFTMDEFRDFYTPLLKIPVISIGVDIPGAKSLYVNNRDGMHNLMLHLLNDHGYKKIACIRGPVGNQEAEIRFNIYREDLRAFNIKYDEDLVVQGIFRPYCGKKELEVLLDERKVSFDAIVCANDIIAVNVLEALMERGCNIPGDIAVAGFDDSEEGKNCVIPLTTVRQPVRIAGEKALDLILRMINNEDVPDINILPAKLVIRNSCGCYSPFNLEKLSFEQSPSYKIDFSDIKSIKNNIVDDVIQILERTNIYYDTELQNLSECCGKMFDIMIENIMNRTKNNFMDELRGLIFNLIPDEHLTLQWDVLLYLLTRRITACFYNSDYYPFIKEMFSNEILNIIENKDRIDYNLRIKRDRSLINLYTLSERLISLYQPSELKKFIIENFSLVNVSSVCIFLFKSGKNGNKGVKRFLYFNSDQNINQTRDDTIYDVGESIYEITDQNKGKSYAAMGLYYKNRNAGVVLLEIHNLSGIYYETLSSQLSNVLENIRYINKIKNYSTGLEKKVELRTRRLSLAKKKIEEQNEKLKKLDHLKNDFIANITHDFRSPLTAILNMADLGKKYLPDIDEENRYNYNVIYTAGLKLKSAIDRLLELAKMEAKGIKLKIRSINLNKYLENLFIFYSSSIVGSDIEIKMNLPENTIENFHTDPDKLEEVINNLMFNAIKFVNQTSGVITVKLTELESSILLEIRDNGIGIEKNKLKSIFNRFEQAEGGRNSRYQGTGIGLAFSRQLIDYLKGKIWAESAGKNKGSSFFIELSKDKNVFDKNDFYIDDSKEKTGLEKEQIETIIKSEIERLKDLKGIKWEFGELNNDGEFNYKKAKILIVDDDINIREIVKKYLKLNGYQNFIIASNGKQGLEAVYDHEPDLIVCDYNMPEMKGDVFQNELMNNPNFRKIPFLFLSAIVDKNLITQTRKDGALAFLKKPIEEDELIVNVEQSLKSYFEYLTIYKIAIKDELTHVNNRREILRILNHELSKRVYRNISVIYFDVDDFKYYNDKFGHRFGDIILKRIGDILNESLRNYDISARYGGDEFLVVLPDTNLNQASHVAENLRKKISETKIVDDDTEAVFTSSFGVSSLIDNEKYICKGLGIENLREIYDVDPYSNKDWNLIENQKKLIAGLLIEMADSALYKSKETRCNSCRFSSKKRKDFPDGKCPECSGTDLTVGKNRIEIFQY